MLIPVILADTLAFERRRIRSSAERFGKGGEPTCIAFVGAAPSAGPPRQSALQDLTVGAPWERIGIDLTRRHPRSRRGNNYILTYVDHFTKFAEALPIPNKEAATVCTVLVEQVFPRFGTPIQILSDQGKEFDNRLMRGLCEVLGIVKIRTTPYKASTNGAVERFHWILNAMLGRVVSENQLDWDVKLPGVMAAYRASRHDATGYSPNFLMFRRDLMAPIHIVLREPSGSEYTHTHTR